MIVTIVLFFVLDKATCTVVTSNASKTQQSGTHHRKVFPLQKNDSMLDAFGMY